MNHSDVAAITLHTAFNKRWWESKASNKTKGTGVPEALAKFEKACPPDISHLTLGALDLADATCESLRKALKAAAGKCGKDQKDTSDGITKMLGLLGPYEGALGDRRKALTNEAFALGDALHKLTQLVAAEAVNIAKVPGELALLHSRVGNYRHEASGSLMASAKKLLLDDLAAEEKHIETMRGTLQHAANAIKGEEMKSVDLIKKGRSDSRSRPLVEAYNKARATFEKKYAETYDASQVIAAEIHALAADLKGAGTADHAIELIERMADAIEHSPNLQVFGHTIDLMKEWTPELAKMPEDAGTLSRESWKKLVDLEEEFEEQTGRFDTAYRELQTTLKRCVTDAARFPGVVLIEKALQRAKAAAAVKEKEHTDVRKFAPTFETRLKELLKHHP